jgi:hypothetical protein
MSADKPEYAVVILRECIRQNCDGRLPAEDLVMQAVVRWGRRRVMPTGGSK